jgi:hypothetical protein
MSVINETIVAIHVKRAHYVIATDGRHTLGSEVQTNKQTNKQTPWSESASELYVPSDRRLSAK